MRKLLSAVVLALALFVPSVSRPAPADLLGQSGVKMVIRSENGEKLAHKIVTYRIYDYRGEWGAVWEEVKWYKRDGKVALFAIHYSTTEGNITNLKVGKDLATFDIIPLAASIRVIIRPPNEHAMTNDIRAIAVYPDVTEEWAVTDEPIFLPSKEVFGIPTAGDKTGNK